MYQELNTQFLHNEQEFNNAKSVALLNIQCYICANVFQQTKAQIKTNYKRSKSKIFTCSTDCTSRHRNTSQEVQCASCDVTFIKQFKAIQKSISGNHFCSHQCSAKFNNKLRDEDVYIRQAQTLRDRYSAGEIEISGAAKQRSLICGPFAIKGKCTICNNIFFAKSHRKTCSEECLAQSLKNISINNPHVILNRSNPESYLEKSFREYIEQNGYVKNETFYQDKWFKINEKIYFADFYFPKLNLIFELDGKQHEDQIDYDNQRDIAFSTIDIKTNRITWKEWQSKTKQDVVNSELGI